MINFGSQRGQILLIVILTMIVALTVGLSVVSRTITNLRIAKQSEESQRAFQAAEAGIEKTLESGASALIPQALGNDAQYKTEVKNPTGQQIILNGGEVVEQNVGIDVWLSDYPNHANQICPAGCTVSFHFNTTEQSCSAGSGNNTRAALEIVMLSGSVLNPTLTRHLFDPCPGRTLGAETASTGGTIEAVIFQHAVNVRVTNGIIARVIPIYNSVKVGVTSSVNIPVQGRMIESTGQSGDTIRKVQYFQSHPQLPLEMFPYSIISQE
jgi:hypothetical protein